MLPLCSNILRVSPTVYKTILIERKTGKYSISFNLMPWIKYQRKINIWVFRTLLEKKNILRDSFLIIVCNILLEIIFNKGIYHLIDIITMSLMLSALFYTLKIFPLNPHSPVLIIFFKAW